MSGTTPSAPLARNVRRLAHLDLPGAGQVYIAGRHAFIGISPTRSFWETTILDIADRGSLASCLRSGGGPNTTATRSG